MICKNCGQGLSNESIFCNKCGTKVETTVEDLKTVVKETIDVVEKVQTGNNEIDEMFYLYNKTY